MSTTLTVKGQVTIPKTIRDHLRLVPGDQIEFEFADDGSVRMRPTVAASRKPARSKFAALVGRRRQGGRTAELMEMLRGYEADQEDPGFR